MYASSCGLTHSSFTKRTWVFALAFAFFWYVSIATSLDNDRFYFTLWNFLVSYLFPFPTYSKALQIIEDTVSEHHPVFTWNDVLKGAVFDGTQFDFFALLTVAARPPSSVSCTDTCFSSATRGTSSIATDTTRSAASCSPPTSGARDPS